MPGLAYPQRPAVPKLAGAVMSPEQGSEGCKMCDAVMLLPCTSGVGDLAQASKERCEGQGGVRRLFAVYSFHVLQLFLMRLASSHCLEALAVISLLKQGWPMTTQQVPHDTLGHDT